MYRRGFLDGLVRVRYVRVRVRYVRVRYVRVTYVRVTYVRVRIGPGVRVMVRPGIK